jgi:uncharacterized SAM-binding protein YcdF (DUF218 family)
MDTVFFIASKLLGALIRPETWLVILLGLTVLALLRGRQGRALVWSGATFLSILLLSIFPLGELLLQPIERQYPTSPQLSNVDGIIVLGGGEESKASAYWGQVQLNHAGERMTAALELAHRFPDAKVLFTGASGSLRDVAIAFRSDTFVMEKFFTDQGLALERLILEKKARNTAENAQLSYELAQPKAGQNWVLITSAYHMPRAMRSFETAGWPPLTAWPVDYRSAEFSDRIGWNFTRNLDVLNRACKEYVGSLVYRLTGR